MTSSTGHLPPLRRPLPRPNVPFSMCSFASSTTSDCQALQLLNDYPPGTRPIYSYHTLIRAALLDTPNQSRTATEIVQAIEDKFPYFKTERGQPCRYYILNTLSNTPSFVPNGQGPNQDELYWTYNSTLDGQRATSILSCASSPSTASTLVNTLYQPKEDDKDDNELDLGLISEQKHRDTEVVRKLDERRDPERRVIKKQREARTEEWARQTHGVNRKASDGNEGKQEVVKVDRVQAKLTKEQPPPPPDPKDLEPPKRLKKDGHRHDQGCCIIM